MFKKFLASITVAAVVVSLVVTPTVTSYANEGDGDNISGSQDSGGTSDSDDTNQSSDSDQNVQVDPPATDTVTVPTSEGKESVVVESITVEQGKTAISASSSDASVKVIEDVTATGTTGEKYQDALGNEYYKSKDAVVAKDGATVEIGKDLNATGDEQTGITATGGAVVTVGGDVKANGYGIQENNSNVTVEGNVNSADDAIYAHDGGTVVVEGNVSSSGMHEIIYSDYDKEIKDYKTKKLSYDGLGINTDGTTDIFVDGDVIGTTTAIGIYRGADTQDKKGNIIVTGTIASMSENHSRISISNSTRRDENGNEITAKYNTLEDLIAGVPNITVYAFDKSYVSVGRTVEDDKATYGEIFKAVTDTINFIIKKDEDIKFTDDNENIHTVTAPTSENFDTVNVGKSFKVAAKVPEGYMLSGGDNVKVTDNNDGTYSLVLFNPKGGILIKAVVRPVPEDKSEKSSDENQGEQQYEVVVQEVAPAYADPNQAPAGAIVVANTSTATAAPEIAAISGDKPARTVSYSISNITPIQYKNSIIQNVAEAPKGGAFNIETDRVACFDAKMIQAFAARPDIDVNVVFTYGGRRLKVVIPAGYNVASLLDDYGYCGFLRLLSILGGTEI